MQTSISARHRVGGQTKGPDGVFGEGSGFVQHFERVVRYAVSTNKPPPPGANRLTFCRWREEGKRANSSEGLAAGLYLRVKKWTRNCSEDIKKIPLKLRSYQCQGCSRWNFKRIFFSPPPQHCLHTVCIQLTINYHKHLNCCINALLLFVLCFQSYIWALFLPGFDLDNWNFH